MGSSRNRMIEDLFHQSLERDEDDRTAFLEQACGSDSLLKDEVQTLLDAMKDDTSFQSTIEKVITKWKSSVQDAMESEGETQGYANDLPFNQLGDYRFIRRLGRGGMGEVFEAEQVSLKKRVAVKILPRLIGLSEKAVRDFYAEATTGAQLKHPNIVSIIAVHCIDGVHLIVQELIEGGRNLTSLFDRKHKGTRKARSYYKMISEKVASVARALQHAHEGGFIHRDIKPTNILIDEKNKPLVCDFGLARRMDGTSYAQSQDFSGTTPYMSPEQTRGHNARIDHRTDIFSLGATLYEALTLKRAFSGDTSNEIVRKLRTSEPEQMSRIDKRIPSELAAICARAMEKKPERRYQNMREFAADLDCFAEGLPLSSQTIGWFWRTMRWTRKYKTRITVCASILLALIITGGGINHWFQMQYESISVALKWKGHDQVSLGVNWVLHIDPKDLNWSIYTCLLGVVSQEHVTNDLLLKTDNKLDVLLKTCRERGETKLADDVSFLQAYAKKMLANMEDDPEIRKRYLKEIEMLMESQGFFNPYSSQSLFRRKGLEECISEGLRINKRNPNVLLFRGVARFSPLYKGGTKDDFEETVSCLEGMLEENHARRIGLATLGRTYFFWARSFWNHDFLKQAETYTKAAISLSISSPSEMIYTTLGQIELLRENYEAALTQFEIARNIPGANESSYHFNTLCGLGKTWLHLGDQEKALQFMNAAYTNYTKDPYVNAALAEYYFARKEISKALEYATLSVHPKPAAKTDIAYSYLLLARIHVVLGNTVEIIENLENLYWEAEKSPRDQCLACLLCVALVEEDSPSKDYFNKQLVGQAENMIKKSSMDASDLHIFRSAMGAYAFLLSEFDTTCKELSVVRTYSKKPEFQNEKLQYKMKSACDLYFLAMAWQRKKQNGSPKSGAPEPMDIFREAEAIYNEQIKNGHFIEYWDIYERIRNKAKAVLRME